MLHAVAVRPRQIDAQERIGVGLEIRQLAEHRNRFADDALDVLGERIGFRFGAVVRQRDAEGRRRSAALLPIVDRELTQHEVAEVGRAVHQVVDVRRGEDQRIGGRKQLRGDAPFLSWRLHERHARRPLEPAAREHQRGGNVDVRVHVVDAEIGAVGAIAEDLVGDDDGAVVAGDVPLMRIGTRRGDRLALAVGDRHVEDVLRELVERVTAGRGARHPQLQRAGRHVRESRFDLHPAMLAAPGTTACIQSAAPAPRPAELTSKNDDNDGERKHVLSHFALSMPRTYIQRMKKLLAAVFAVLAVTSPTAQSDPKTGGHGVGRRERRRRSIASIATSGDGRRPGSKRSSPRTSFRICCRANGFTD